VVVLAQWPLGHAARASDFWDKVRTPGIGAHRLHLQRGGEALAANRPDLAQQEAEAAILHCPTCGGGHVLRGRALAAIGRNGEAVAAFERAAALQPDALDRCEDAMVAAMCAINVGRAELGVAVLRRMLVGCKDQSTQELGLLMLADALQVLGPAELRNALVAYREAMQDGAMQAQAAIGLALALHRSGDVEQGLTLARRAGMDAGRSTAGGWLPGPERAARLALWLTAIGDLPAASDAWLRAADGDGPWSNHARATRSALQGVANQ
jgi:cytochrome c-type biogenesis protein CcmH/NrfG